MAPEQWIDIGRLEDIPRHGCRRVTGPPGCPAIAVFRTGDDMVFALHDRCPHRGGPLSEGIVQGHAVACPLHGWVIDLGDGQAEPPDEGCVGTVPVKLVAGRISLAASARAAIVGSCRDPA